MSTHQHTCSVCGSGYICVDEPETSKWHIKEVCHDCRVVVETFRQTLLDKTI